MSPAAQVTSTLARRLRRSSVATCFAASLARSTSSGSGQGVSLNDGRSSVPAKRGICGWYSTAHSTTIENGW